MDNARLADIAAIDHLTASEIALREAGRAEELVPDHRAAADRYFRWADRVRAERLELLDRCGLNS